MKFDLREVLLVTLCLMTSSLVSSQIGLNTTYDGVMPTVLNNSYLVFDGSVGVSYQDGSFPTLTSYQLSVWFRTSVTPAQIQRNMNIISVKE